MGKRFNPSRGGHAPGHLRDLFILATDMDPLEPFGSWIEFLDDDSDPFYNPEKQAWWKNLSKRQRGLWVIGQLWNCTDIMPSILCDSLEFPQGSSYAQGVRRIRKEME